MFGSSLCIISGGVHSGVLGGEISGKITLKYETFSHLFVNVFNRKTKSVKKIVHTVQQIGRKNSEDDP